MQSVKSGTTKKAEKSEKDKSTGGMNRDGGGSFQRASVLANGQMGSIKISDPVLAIKSSLLLWLVLLLLPPLQATQKSHCF